MRFLVNGYFWRLEFVHPESNQLIDRTGEKRVATTDPNMLCIYLSTELHGDFLEKVLTHELGHVVMFSYNLLDELHRFVLPVYWVEAEEWVCNFLADYWYMIRETVGRLLHDIRFKAI